MRAEDAGDGSVADLSLTYKKGEAATLAFIKTQVVITNIRSRHVTFRKT